MIQPDEALVLEIKALYRSRQQLSLEQSNIQAYLEWIASGKIVPGKPTFVLLTGETTQQFLQRHHSSAVDDSIEWHDDAIESFLKV